VHFPPGFGSASGAFQGAETRFVWKTPVCGPTARSTKASSLLPPRAAPELQPGAWIGAARARASRELTFLGRLICDPGRELTRFVSSRALVSRVVCGRFARCRRKWRSSRVPETLPSERRALHRGSPKLRGGCSPPSKFHQRPCDRWRGGLRPRHIPRGVPVRGPRRVGSAPPNGVRPRSGIRDVSRAAEERIRVELRRAAAVSRQKLRR